MYAGIAPRTNPSIEDLLTKKYDAGGNVGNLMFINAVGESTDPKGDNYVEITHYRADVTNAETINRNFDCFLLPLADAFRDDNVAQLKRLTALIKKLRIPCVVVGVGLRARYDSAVDEPHAFDEAVKGFVRAVLEKSACLGLRGERTALYLRHLGFREEQDFTQIGCPSMCMAGVNLKIKDVKLPQISHIALNGNDLAAENISKLFRRVLEDYPDSYIVQQRESEIADIYIGKYAIGKKFRVDGSLYGVNLYGRMLPENRIKGFSNIYRWTEFLSKMDFCLSSRFHGTVASLLAGVPSLIIPIDSRMQEMVEYHAIPHVAASDVMETDTLESLISRVDIHSSERVAKRNLCRYFDFLDRNQLPHVSYDYIPTYKYVGGGGYSDWKLPEKPFLELSRSRRVGRIVKFYTKKVENKIARK